MALLVLDLFATYCFASTGAYIALRKKSSFFGIFLSAMLTATGGGTVREILLASRSLFWLENYLYLLVVVISSIIAVFLSRQLSSRWVGRFNLIHEFCTCVFIIVGIVSAIEANCGPVFIPVMGMLTGIGGTILREVIIENDTKLVHDQKVTITAVLQAILGSLLIHSGVHLFVTLAALLILYVFINRYFTLALSETDTEGTSDSDRSINEFEKKVKTPETFQAHYQAKTKQSNNSVLMRKEECRRKIRLQRIERRML